MKMEELERRREWDAMRMTRDRKENQREIRREMRESEE